MFDRDLHPNLNLTVMLNMTLHKVRAWALPQLVKALSSSLNRMCEVCGASKLRGRCTLAKPGHFRARDLSGVRIWQARTVEAAETDAVNLRTFTISLVYHFTLGLKP